MGPATTPSSISIAKRSGRHYEQLGRLQKLARLCNSAWFDIVVAMCAFGGLIASTLYQVQIRTVTFAGSDFKTLYASIWCFTHRMNAYEIANLQKVFVANGVVQPQWWGHAPVYPWTTLAFLSPLASLGMVPAIYVLIILSGALLAIAVAALMRYAANDLDLGPFWRATTAGLCASGPLLGFGIDLGNVSVAASAFCILAFVWRKSELPWTRESWRWIPGAALAAAFVLKPHLAFWAGVGMMLLPERAARAVVLRACALIAAFTALAAVVMAAMGTLALQTHAYLAMIGEETSAGSSMNATSRIVLPIVAEITSLDSILGFWITHPAIRIGLTYATLLGLGYVAVRQTRRVGSERAALLAVGMWCTFGLLATYHRAPDAVLLLLAVPWALDRVRRTPFSWHPWVAVTLYCAMSVSADFPVVEHWVAVLPPNSLLTFLLLRQAGLADCLLLIVMLLAMRRERAYQVMTKLDPTEAEVPEIAA